MKTIFLVLAVLALTTLADDRLRIEIFAESKCPDCIGYLSTSLKTAIYTTDIEKIANITIYPYGNAKQT